MFFYYNLVTLWGPIDNINSMQIYILSGCTCEKCNMIPELTKKHNINNYPDVPHDTSVGIKYYYFYYD